MPDLTRNRGLNLGGVAGEYYALDYGIKADGQTNDGPALNALFQLVYANGGGRVVLPSGVVIRIGTTVELVTGLDLVIPFGTVLRALPSLNGNLIEGIGVNYVRLSGGGTLDVGPAQLPPGLGVHGLYLTGAFGAEIRDLIITNAGGDGLHLDNCFQVSVIGVQVQQSYVHGIVLNNCTNCVLAGVHSVDNAVGGAGSGDGISLQGTTSHTTFAACRAYDDRGTKLQAYGWREAAGMTGDYNVFAGCDFNGNLTGSVSVVGAHSGSTTTGAFSNATLANPTITGAPATTAGTLGIANNQVTIGDGTTSHTLSFLDSSIRNLLVNGGFEIWQRGNGPFTANNAYAADRWQVEYANFSTLSVSKDTTNQDTASTACAALSFSYNGSPGQFQQSLEDYTQLRGRTVSFSVRVKTTTANAICPFIADSVNPQWTGNFHSGSGSYETLTVTATIAATTTTVVVGVRLLASCTAYVDNAMLVIGSQPVSYVPLTPAEEWERCQRYYETAGDSANPICTGHTWDGTTEYLIWTYQPVRKSVTPTLTLLSGSKVTNVNGTDQAYTVSAGVLNNGIVRVIGSKAEAESANRWLLAGVTMEANP